jgi:hypothetical protein
MKKHVLSSLALLGALVAGNLQSAAAEDVVYQVPETIDATNGDSYSDGVITMTMGPANEDNGWTVGKSKVIVNEIEFPRYASSKTNPNPKGNGKIPTTGTYFQFAPKNDGTITVVVYGAGNTKQGFVAEVKPGEETSTTLNGILIGNGTSETAWTGGTVLNSDASYSGGLKFEVTGGNTYYFYLSGSNVRVNGFIYTYGEAGGETGINNIEVSQRTASVIYDLCGNRVSTLNHRGLYIVDGKKVLVK